MEKRLCESKRPTKKLRTLLAPKTIDQDIDITLEILVRLPIKSILRFTCVSKLWYLNLKTSQFCSRRAALPPFHKPASGILFNRDGLFYDPSHDSSLDFINFNQTSKVSRLYVKHYETGFEILSSCKGLLLCSKEDTYFIQNPTTGHDIHIPPPPPLIQSEGPITSLTILGLTLVFDPSKSTQYNVICVRQVIFIGTIQFCIQIYSSETKCWLQSDNVFTAPENFKFIGGVYWNGAVHWINIFGAPSGLYFKVDEDMVNQMPMPQNFGVVGKEKWDEREWGYFGESGDHLHLICSSDSPSTKLFLYEMERNYSRWFIKFHIDLNPVVTQFPEMVSDSHRASSLPIDLFYMRFSILGVVRCEVEEESFMVLQIPGKILRYNFNTSSFNKICDSDGTLSYGLQVNKRWYTVFQFIESLASA